MYLFSKEFVKDFFANPGEALVHLKQHNSLFVYPLVRFVVFWRIVFSEYLRNQCITRASALAYAMLLTLIPLVTSATYMVAGFMDVQPGQVRSFFALLLPFAPSTLLEYLTSFFINAQQIRGIGLLVLIVVAAGLFGGIEAAFNGIWKVARSRSFFIRLRAFTMVMVYAPVLFLLSFQFRRSAWFDFVSGYFLPLDIVPFLLIVLAFSSIIWFVPTTRVNLKAAFLGGAIAGILFELERRGFSRFVQYSFQTKTIYGTLWILPLFLASLFLIALIILLGAQVAYVHQNFNALLRTQKRWDRRISDYKTYVTMRIMIDCVAAFMKKQKLPTVRFFSSTYEITDAQAMGIVTWLIHEGLLHAVGAPSTSGFIPTRDFSQTPVRDVITLIENQGRKISAFPDDAARQRLARIITALPEGSTGAEAHITFAQLINQTDQISEAR